MSDVPREPRAAKASAGANAGAEVIPFAIVEEFYKRPGRTLTGRLLGFDLMDFWIGRFYVGIWGLLALIGIVIGVSFYLYDAFVVEGTYNLLAARIDPPPISAGLGLPGAGEPGLPWLVIMVSATVAFVSWALRQLDITLKLDMTPEVPLAFGAVVTSWITLQWLRPIAMGAWGNGFPLGITHHLDWVSNIGYQYFNFFYNPFHALGITLLFASTLFLNMHGSAILSAAGRPDVHEKNVDVFWRNIVGYSIGEIGIHRLAFWTGALAVIVSNLCILLSGPVVHSWNRFWSFWTKLPFWSLSSGMFLMGVGLVGIVVSRRARRDEPVDIEAAEHGSGLEGTLGKPTYIRFMDRLFGNGQTLPIYLGVWGVAAVSFGALTAFIILSEFLWKVGYNPILFLREFFFLSLNPSVASYGLQIAPWHEGGAWFAATFFLHLAVLAWWARVWTRARATGIGTQLAWGFTAALSLYFVIYLIRPIILGRWTDAPGHGFVAILNWTNYVSIQTGNFYYNPFHMLSIFFLLGSTLLLAMHGATIVATSRWGSEREIEEMWAEGPGTQRAQLFWRWVMGWNANSYSIHAWLWWFAALTAITGAIGLLLSGWLIPDWFKWAETVRIVAPWPSADWAQFVFK